MNRMIRIATLLLLPVLSAQAGTAEPKPRIGDMYRLERVSESIEQRDGGMAGSSYDRDALIERVIATGDTGTELEFDLPNPTAQDSDITWQLPARVLRPVNGPLRLLNAAELQVRADRWLKRAKLDRTACGHWVFTWTAVRIECDPQSAIAMIGQVDWGAVELRDGASYRSPLARAPAPLTRKSTGPGGATFTVDLAIDPDKIREGRVEADLVTAEIMRKPLTRDEAVRAHSNEDISGTIATTFDTDPDGQPWRRTTVTRAVIKGTDGKVETRTTTETLTRKLVPRRGS